MLYFAYGSNMNHDQMSRRCPDAVFHSSYWLRGWALDFDTHATIRPHRRVSVPGALWRITPKDLHALDSYEGCPTYYRRRRWQQDGQYFFFYEMNSSNSNPPRLGYLEGIIQGYLDCGITEPKDLALLDQWMQHCYNNT